MKRSRARRDLNSYFKPPTNARHTKLDLHDTVESVSSVWLKMDKKRPRTASYLPCDRPKDGILAVPKLQTDTRPLPCRAATKLTSCQIYKKPRELIPTEDLSSMMFLAKTDAIIAMAVTNELAQCTINIDAPSAA